MSSAATQPPGLAQAVADARAGLIDTAALLYQRGWAFGTSGNYSVVVQADPRRLLVTASGRDKRALTPADFVLIDADGRVIEPAAAKPSAETMLHVVLAARPGIGSVLHTHSVWNTLLSDRHFTRGSLTIAGYEMLKGLAGITTHESSVDIPIFDNTQDIDALSLDVRARFGDGPSAPPHAFLIRGHGLYTWGRDLAEARRHVEILEFLFEVVGRRD